MKIAVTYENGNVFQHFGHTAQFKLYEIQDGAVVSSQIVPTDGAGHGALAGFLKERNVSALICGGIGGGAKDALSANGIKLYGGVSGSADEAAAALAGGTLVYNSEASCSRHAHEHGENHQCGNHSCGPEKN